MWTPHICHSFFMWTHCGIMRVMICTVASQQEGSGFKPACSLGVFVMLTLKKMLVHNLSSFEKQKFNIQSSCILPIRTARHTSFPHQPTLYLTVSSCSFVFRFHSAYSPVKKKKNIFTGLCAVPWKSQYTLTASIKMKRVNQKHLIN